MVSSVDQPDAGADDRCSLNTVKRRAIQFCRSLWYMARYQRGMRSVGWMLVASPDVTFLWKHRHCVGTSLGDVGNPIPAHLNPGTQASPFWQNGGAPSSK